MIEANELRIGNLFQDEITKEILRVSEIKTETGEVNEKPIVFFHVLNREKFPLPEGWKATPIILTEEILLKLGFNDADYKKGYIGKEFKSNLILDFVLTKPKHLGDWLDCYVFELGNHRIVPIKYLHELQNFYFAITKQELTF